MGEAGPSGAGGAGTAQDGQNAGAETGIEAGMGGSGEQGTPTRRGWRNAGAGMPPLSPGGLMRLQTGEPDPTSYLLDEGILNLDDILNDPFG